MIAVHARESKFCFFLDESAQRATSERETVTYWTFSCAPQGEPETARRARPNLKSLNGDLKRSGAGAAAFSARRGAPPRDSSEDVDSDSTTGTVSAASG